MENIHVKGHIGSFRIIATEEIKSKVYHLLESNLPGDDRPNLIVDEDHNLILDEVWNGFDDLHYSLENNSTEDEYIQEM